MEDRIVTHPFAESERTRFRNLLELAHGSQFEGERQNALEAAKRLAKRHGMSVEEAAHLSGQSAAPAAAPAPRGATEPVDLDRFRRAAVSMDDILAAKKKRNDALRRARERGLDREEKPAGKKNQFSGWRHKNQTRRNPQIHATVLLRETSLPFREIADITGLDFYLVVGLKLKLRKAA